MIILDKYKNLRQAKLTLKKKRFKTQREFFKKILSSGVFKIFAFFFGIIFSMVMLLVFSPSFRNGVIDVIATLINVFVISNLFVCNLIIVGVIIIAILITIFIYTRI